MRTITRSIALAGVLGSVLAAGSSCGKASPTPVDDSCDGPSDCTDPTLPYCVDAACHACDGASACTPDTPRCSPADLVCSECVGDLDCTSYPSLPRCSNEGACVGCIESSQCANPTPVCDNATCRGCSSDDDCASSTCEQSTGTCISEAAVLYATPTGTDTACTKVAPCALVDAIAAIDAAHRHIKLAGGIYQGGETLIGGTTVALHGLGATLRAELSIRDGATVRIDDLTIDSRLSCSPSSANAAIPSVELHRVTVDTVDALACTIAIHDSRFTPASSEQSIRARADAMQRRSIVTMARTIIDGGEGLCIENSTYHITSSVIANLSDTPGVSAFVCSYQTQAPGNTVDFTTFYNAPISCGDGPASSVLVSNSIVFGDRRSTDITSGNQCTFRYTLANPQLVLAGEGNVLGATPLFADRASNNFRLMPNSPAIDRADIMATAPIDLDGIPRQGRADLGAFEYLTPQ